MIRQLHANARDKVRGKVRKVSEACSELSLSYRVNRSYVPLGRITRTHETIEKIIRGEFALPLCSEKVRRAVEAYHPFTGQGKLASNVAYHALEEFPPIFDYGEFEEEYSPRAPSEIFSMEFAQANTEGFRTFYFYRKKIAELAPTIIVEGVDENSIKNFRQLLEAHESARKVRRAIALANLGLAKKEASEQATEQFRKNELLGVAFEGLMRAVDLYDMNRGSKFSSYAHRAIRSSIQRAFGIEKTSRQRRTEYLSRNWKTLLQSQRDVVPRKVDAKLVSELVRVMPRYVLDRRRKKALALYFGLNGFHPHTLREVGEKLGVGKERARQLIKSALEKIRNAVE